MDGREWRYMLRPSSSTRGTLGCPAHRGSTTLAAQSNLHPQKSKAQKTKCRPSRPKSQNTSMDRNEGKTDALHRPQRHPCPVEPRPHDGGDVLPGLCAASVTLRRTRKQERKEGRNSDGYGNVSVGESLRLHVCYFRNRSGSSAHRMASGYAE
ncbi:hypothetical protein B0H14DRAFT_319000 [Mycena olivaceomarginata]|nr:hypothetical protein B0H14DRAFT_319000 [Mycena olivaceomarginata]